MFKKFTVTATCVVLASVAMSADASAAGRGAKVASGKTAQGRTMRVKVMPHEIKLIAFSIELRCSGGYTLVDQESNFLPSAVGWNGRIHDAQVGTTDEILIRGRLRGRTVGGRIRVRDRLGKYRCSSPWVSFTVRERG